MANSKLLMAAVAALALGVAGPAFAQTSAGANTTGASGDHSDTTVTNVNKTLTYSPSETSTENWTKNTSYSAANSSQHNGNIHLVADQTLDASISNEGDLYFDGDRANYASGNNSVNGSAFAAYSGILNQGWNTGVNSNAQAATNIAAQGTTSFTTH